MGLRKFLKTAFLIVIIIVILLVVLEVFTRFLWVKPGYGYPPDLFIPDDSRGFKYNPGFSGNFVSQLYDGVEIRINSRGLRDNEHDLSKDKRFRILALGDSVTFGSGVSFEDTYLHKLENKFNENDFNVEIIKAGINSYEFEQEFKFLFEEGFDYDPGLILVGIVLNDAGSVNISAVSENLFSKEEQSIQRFKSFVRSCRFCDFLYTSFKYFVLLRGKDYDSYYFDHVYSKWEGESWDYTQEQMKDMIKEAKKRDIEVVLVVFPYVQQFSHSDKKWDNKPQKTLESFSDKQGIYFLDLLPFFDREDYSDFYLRNDAVHFNPDGHEVVSEVLYDFFVENKLIEN